ncbi:unnamed protein product [Bemisia tabaci]|uniref:Uncharacterized protein n=1 Tax=Bemisia tabaci TaxID=7038 RepID=A0A9P0AEU4_BEMTA|nr:unnamed protein product [Bemisia tabaci]
MCNVTKKNFTECLSNIKDELKTATFVAIDSEFSGLLSDAEFKSSLFDSGDDRYLKLKSCLQQVIMMEVGLSIFKYDRDTHAFKASVYNFYVFPQPFGSIDARFLFQASSVQFLCLHGFDFNKVMFEGIPYLNVKQEIQIREEIQKGSLFRHLERNISMETERILQNECSKVAEWASTSIVGDDLLLKVYWLGEEPKLMNFILHQEIRRRFHNLWTYTAPEEQVRVVRITESQHKDLVKKGVSKDLEDSVIDALVGFSKIVKLLMEFKKPIVGHNLLLDLLILHNQFYLPLPKTYKEFKASIRLLFPQVYDTKFLSFELKRLLKKEDAWTVNTLQELYNYFKKGKGTCMVIYSPSINFTDDIDESSIKYHEAGWDSFVTGYCFVKIANMFAVYKENKFFQASRMLTCTEIFNAIKHMRGRVNLIRANISNLNLEGDDPLSTRPELLYVASRNFSCPIDLNKVTELFARYGSVDVKPYSSGSALVAVSTHGCAQDILRDFKNSKHLKVSSFNRFKHSPIAKAAVWTGVLAMTSLCSWLTYKHVLKK